MRRADELSFARVGRSDEVDARTKLEEAESSNIFTTAVLGRHGHGYGAECANRGKVREDGRPGSSPGC